MDEKTPNSNRKNNSNKIYFDSKINSFIYKLNNFQSDLINKMDIDVFSDIRKYHRFLEIRHLFLKYLNVHF